jgi:hypothetical protein
MKRSTKTLDAFEKTLNKLHKNSTNHKHFAIVQQETGYMGGGCDGPTVFLTFAAKTAKGLKRTFEENMALSFVSSIQNSSNDASAAVKKAMQKGSIYRLFEHTDMKVDVADETYRLLHYGNGDENTIANLFLAKNENGAPKSNGDDKKYSGTGIAEKLGIWEYRSYEAIPATKRAWITIKAKKAGKNPNMVHAGIKACFNARANRGK